MKSEMLVFSGSSNKPLAAKLIKKLGLKLGKVRLSRFANGEAQVHVEEKMSDGTAVVLQSLSTPPDEHLVELVLICDALKRLGASKIVAVVPWLGYSKQDKVFRSGEPLSVKVIAKMLQVAPLDRLITFDLHNPSILGFFDVPVVNLSAQPLFLGHFGKLDKSELVVVAADAGAVKSSTAFAGELGVPVAYIDKERNLETGEVTIHGINRQVAGKDIVMVEDMIVTGATLVETSKFLKNSGVKRILVAATHHLFLPDVSEKLEAALDQILITDTICKPAGAGLKKTKILSCAGLIADSLSGLY
jgi:ribose-phosphate pyrophosphokinase